MQFCFHVQSANSQQNDTKNTTTNIQMKKNEQFDHEVNWPCEKKEIQVNLLCVPFFWLDF